MILKRGFPSSLILRGFGVSGIPAEVLTCIDQILTHIASVLTHYAWAAVIDPQVIRGGWRFDADVDQVPLVVIIPNKPEAARTAYGLESQRMRVDVSTVVRVGEDENPSERGEAILGEMIAAAFSNVPGGASAFEYQGGGVDQYPEFTVDLMTVGITIAVGWEVNPGNVNVCA